MPASLYRERVRAELIDDLGHPVPLPRPPRRVVSLVPSLTETVTATAPGLLVGATDWCPVPDGLTVTRVRGPKNPDLAAVRALGPDLVIASQEENRRLDVERLRQAQVPVWVVRVDALDQAFTSLERLLGQALGLGCPAWLEQARREWSRPAPEGGRVAVPVWRDPWLWAGAGTFADDLLGRLGWQNVAADLGERYPRAEPDQVAALGPDLLLLPDEPYRFTPDDLAGVRVPGCCVAGRWLFWYGPALAESRSALLRAVESM